MLYLNAYLNLVCNYLIVRLTSGSLCISLSISMQKLSLAFVYMCHEQTYSLYKCISSVRAFYHSEPIVVINDNGDKEVEKLTSFLNFTHQYYDKNIGAYFCKRMEDYDMDVVQDKYFEYLRRMLRAFESFPEEVTHVMRLEDDVRIQRRIVHIPNADVIGSMEHHVRVPDLSSYESDKMVCGNCGGGCIIDRTVFTTYAKTMLANTKLFRLLMNKHFIKSYDIADQLGLVILGHKSFMKSICLSENPNNQLAAMVHHYRYDYGKPLNLSRILRPKIIDAFILYNELDLLLYRLDQMNYLVSHFVIVEGSHTFAGKVKPSIYLDNIEKFAKYRGKIWHHIVDLSDKSMNPWAREHKQRNAIASVILSHQNDINDEDLVIVSDLDEIPDHKKIRKIYTMHQYLPRITSLLQDVYYYSICHRVNETMSVAKLVRLSELKKWKVQAIRKSLAPKSFKCGWHMSYFGDIDFIANKIKNFAHQEFNSSKYTDGSVIADKVKSCIDLFGRSGVKITYVNPEDNPYLPDNHHKFVFT